MLQLVFLIVALVLFILGAIGINSGRISLTNAGLAFLMAAMIVGAGVI